MRALKLSLAVVLVVVGGFGGYLAKTVKRPTWRPLVKVGASERLAFQHARVFTATDAGVLDDAVVLVEDGRITTVGSGVVPPAGWKVVDATGKTLLPGLIDAHVHLINTAAPTWYLALPDAKHNLEAYLYAGVTSVVSMGDDPKQATALEQGLGKGEFPGPRVIRAGSPITRTGGHPEASKLALVPKIIQAGLPEFATQIDTPEQAPAAVEEQLKGGASFVKMVVDDLPGGMPRLEEAHVCALVKAAHAKGVKIVAHVGKAEDALLAAKCGVDALNHEPNLGPMSAEQVAQFADAGIPVVPTMIIFEKTAQFSEGHFGLSELDRAVESPEILEQLSDEATAKNTPHPFLTSWIAQMAKARADRAATVKALHAAGVTILVGTDSSIIGCIAGASLHQEMAMLVAAGVPAEDVLLGVTTRNAHFFWKDPDFGTIEAGKRADLLLVEGDPLTDITATSRIAVLVQGGRVVERLTH